MKKNPKAITFSQAAAELCVSESTVLRLVQRGTLHATRPVLKNGHWARFVIVDDAFNDELHRRLHGLKSPRRKHTPDTDSVQKEFERKAREKRLNEICEQWCKDDPSPIQTVTPPAEPQPSFLVSARAYLATWHLPQPTLYIRHNTATFHFDGEAERLDGLVARAEACADYVMTSGAEHEETTTRCTAILAAACILQLLLAAYYTLCHFNII